MMGRDEHLTWCKQRALEYLDRGEIANALASMGSDLAKHPELRAVAEKMGPVGLIYAMHHDREGARRWIEGFR